MDFTLESEHEEVQAIARAFCEREILPNVQA